MMRNLILVMCLGAAACGQPEEQEWAFDEPIVIWTIPRPGEEPAEVPDEEPVAEVPAELTPTIPVDAEPSVSPVACDANLETLVVPGTLRGSLRRGRGELDEVPCTISPGAEQRFHVEVPRRMGVEIWTSYDETAFPPVLLLQTGCGEDTADVYCSSPLYSHPNRYSSHIRAVLEPGTYTLIVDERSIDLPLGGSFVLHADEFELGDNAMCASPDRLYPDNIGTVALPNRGSTGDLRGCFGSANSRHFWTVQVPARSSYRVRASYQDDDIQQGPFIQIRTECHGSCEGPSDYGEVSIANDTDETVEYVVGVSDSRDQPYEVFIDAFTQLAENAECSMATPLQSGQAVQGDLLAGSAHALLCGFDDTRQLFYQVDVPPQHRLIAETSAGTVAVGSFCGDPQCLQNPVNESGQTQSYIVTVGEYGSERPFEMTANVVALASNSTCLAPRSLELGVPTTGTLVSGGDPAGSCGLIHAGGFTLWYSVEIAPMSAVSVEVRGETEFPSLGLEAMAGGCGGACLGVHDTYIDGPANPRLELANDDTTPLVVLLAVTSESQHAGAEAIEIEVSTLD